MALKTYPGDSKREGKKSLKIKRSFIVGLTIYFALLVNDCATFKKSVTINAALIQDRAQSGHFQEEASRGFTKAQAHTLRIWQTSILFQGKPVWVGQTSTRQGGHFSDVALSEETLPLDPFVDEARNDITQDLAYSQALMKIGFVKGAGDDQANTMDPSSESTHYMTDGLRVVLLFGDRPASLESIDFFNWERLADYR